MPAIRYFTVTQVREVRIAAPEALDAAKAGADIFQGVRPVPGGKAEARGPIIERKLLVEEER